MLNFFSKVTSDKYIFRYVFNTGWLVSDQLFKMLLLAVVGIFVTRYLQPENYGFLSYATSLVALFGSFATLGLNNLVVKDIVRSQEKYLEIIGTAFWLRLIGASLCVFALFVIAKMQSNPVISALIIIMSISLLVRVFEVIPLFYQARVRMKPIIMSQMMAVSLASLARIIGVSLKLNVVAFGFFNLLESILTSSLSLFVFVRETGEVFFRHFNLQIARALLQRSWPLILSSIMVSVYMKIDQVMIAQLASFSETGQYAAAAKLSESWYFIPVAITTSLYPALIKASKNSDLFNKRFQQLSSFLFFISIIVVIPVSVFAKSIVTILYGSSYLPSAAILSVHVWSGPFIFLNLASAQWLIIKNKQKYGTLITAGGAAINILLNLILIPKFGALGSAYATLVAYAFSGYFCYALLKPTRELFINQTRSILNLTFLIGGYKLLVTKLGK